jgi:hypothetical protein
LNFGKSQHHKTPLAKTEAVPGTRGDDMSSASVLRAPQVETSALERLIQRNATEAVLWGMPMVRFDVMRQAFFRDAQASYGDISYWSKPADWKLQMAAPNTLSCYVYFNFNTKNGPVVVEVPESADASLSGSIFSVWEASLVEVGPEGRDKGHGGKFLLLPPEYKGMIPTGCIAVRSDTYNGRAVFFATPSPGMSDASSAVNLVRRMRVYPLAQDCNPPEQRFIDMSGKLFDGVIRFDDSFFDSLARMVSEEPVRTRDLVAMNQIYPLGIDKTRSFAPDRATREILRQTAEEVHAGLMKTACAGERLWPTTHWIRSAVPPRTPFTFETAIRFGIDERNVKFFMAFEAPKKKQEPPSYFCAFCDATGQPLIGDRTYRLRIPATMPVKKGWEVAAYDLATACFIRESPQVAIDSCNSALKNGDGSLDVFFGPEAPAGWERNWIYTAPGEPWFTFFRLYEPDRAFFEKTWVLANLERIG